MVVASAFLAVLSAACCFGLLAWAVYVGLRTGSEGYSDHNLPAYIVLAWAAFSFTGALLGGIALVLRRQPRGLALVGAMLNGLFVLTLVAINFI